MKRGRVGVGARVMDSVWVWSGDNPKLWWRNIDFGEILLSSSNRKPVFSGKVVAKYSFFFKFADISIDQRHFRLCRENTEAWCLNFEPKGCLFVCWADIKRPEARLPRKTAVMPLLRRGNLSKCYGNVYVNVFLEIFVQTQGMINLWSQEYFQLCPISINTSWSAFPRFHDYVGTQYLVRFRTFKC